MSTPKPLESEIQAIHTVIDRLMNEVDDLETLCKHLPRLASVSANVIRIQDALKEDPAEQYTSMIQSMIAEINAEAEAAIDATNDDDTDGG